MKELWPIAVTLCVLMSACSKKPAEPASSAPSHTGESSPSSDQTNGDALRAKLTAGGIETEYTAHFEASHLARIVEKRQTASGSVAGDYRFQGARLIAYHGSKLGSADPIDLRFDMQGVLQPDSGRNLSEDELRGIRGRAQLLRSHALAQRSTRSHSQ